MVMSRFLTRPENAHKKAIELIAIGRKQQALEALLEVFRNKKWMYHWTETVLEPIISLILNLCIDLKRPYVAKEIFYQYRNQVQNVNINSLEKVIRDYLKKAEQNTENAKDKSIQAVTDVDDLDNIATPESIMLSTVSGEDAQDRSDRTILTPWVKFLWESYCQLLELLRTNIHVEHLYHDIAKMAFQFCVKYGRKTEFRKLCDKLRKHLDDINKPPLQSINVCITKPETQQYNLDTRLNLLDCAIQMELWQEAFRAIEDINGLMLMSKKTPLPKTMANFYQKQAMVFWKSGNYLFHAAALFKLFQLSKDMKKNISTEEIQKMASRVLVAVLSIPMPSAHPEFDRFIETDKSAMEKNHRLAMLLGLQFTPTRSTLVRDLVRSHIISLTATQLQNLYQWLEVDFDPLSLCDRIISVIDYLKLEENASLQQYIPALQDVALMRLVRQVAQVYQSMQYSRLLDLARFCDKFRLERLLVDCVRHNDMQIRIDHGKQCIYFGIDLSESQREDRPDGPTLQCMPSEQIRNQLVNMNRVLSDAINVIDPDFRNNERNAIREKLVNYYLTVKDEEHQRILQRHQIIEDRKEYIERMNNAREEEEQRRLEELQRQQMLAEQKRLEQEREERERKKQLNELQSIEEKRKRDKVQQIMQTSLGQKVLKKLDEKELSKLNTEQIAAREAEELQKERREIQMKLKSQEKRADYFERAKRLEEIPLVEKYIAEKHKIDKLYWEEQEEERINKIIEKHNILVSTKERFQKLINDKELFLEQVMKKRKEKYTEEMKKFDEKCKGERAKQLAERKVLRKEQRKEDWLEMRQRELERQQEEQKRKLEEEKKRKEEEREERDRMLRQEREKRDREQAEALERQRRMQQEIEERAEQKIREDKERALKTSGVTPVSNPWRSEAKSTGSWRNVMSSTATMSSNSVNNTEKRYEPPIRNRNIMDSKPTYNRSEREFPKFERDSNWKRPNNNNDTWRRSQPDNNAKSDVNKRNDDGGSWRSKRNDK